MLEFEYARSALKNGLKLEAELGVNPYKFGMVGSTDAHTGLAAVEEDNFFGKTSSSEPSAGPRRRIPSSSAATCVIMGWETDRFRLRRGLGGREHARSRSSTPWSAARPTPRPARGCSSASSAATISPPTDANTREPGLRRLHQGRADGRRPRPGAGRQGADLPRRGAQGPDRRQSRPLPDRQGLARRRGRGPRAGL